MVYVKHSGTERSNQDANKKEMHTFPLPVNIYHPAPSLSVMGTGELALLWAPTQNSPVPEIDLSSFFSLLSQFWLQQLEAS